MIVAPCNATPTAKPAPLANGVRETPLVKSVDIIRPVSSALIIVLNHFIFFANFSQTSISSSR